MTNIENLSRNYGTYIAVPWRSDAAAAQRVIFCVYDEDDERKIRARIGKFENETRQADHDLTVFDLTNTFPVWLSSLKYRQKYFEKPELLPTVMASYLAFIQQAFEKFLTTEKVCENTVVALLGAGSVFGFLKVKEVIEKCAPLIEGRLLCVLPRNTRKQ